MWKYRFFFFSFLMLSCAMFTGTKELKAQPPGREWTLVWSDEFEGSSLDTTKWKVEDNKIRSADKNKTCYEKENVSLSGGILTLSVRNDSCDCGPSYRYSGGMIYSTGPYASNKYGYYEARIRYNCTGPGFWGNFWMNSSEGWPPEFDIAELISNEPTKMTMSYHYNFTSDSVKATGARPLCNWNDWHVYGLEWVDADAPTLRFYIDGVKVFEPTESRSYRPDEFMYVILRMGAYNSSEWGGLPDSSTIFPGKAEYDWVRVWKKTSNPDNKKPSVYLLSPPNNTTYTAYPDVLFNPLYSDTDGKIIKIEYYAGEMKIAEVTTAPFRYTWENVPPGDYTVTAKAYDNDGAVTVSPAIHFIVSGDLASPPTSSNDIEVFPVPVKTSLVVSNGTGYAYTIVAPAGNIVKRGILCGEILLMDDLQDGMYYIVFSRDDHCCVRKVIKQ